MRSSQSARKVRQRGPETHVLANILPHQLLETQPLPTPELQGISPRKGLGITAETIEPIPVLFGQLPNLVVDFFNRQIRPQQFAHGKRMHPIRIIPSHQAVTDLLIDIQPRTPGDKDTHIFPMTIKEPLEKLLPFRIMMQLVKRQPFQIPIRNGICRTKSDFGMA